MELQVKRTIELNKPIEIVWEAFTTSEWTRKYMYGSDVHSTWKVNSDLVWTGEFQGQKFELKGKIKEIIPMKKLVYTNFDPATGIEDKEENYLLVTNELSVQNGQTVLSVTTENFLGDIKRMQHSEQAWDYVLSQLKIALENN